MRPRPAAALRLAGWIAVTASGLVLAGSLVGGEGGGTLAVYAVLDVVLLGTTVAFWWGLQRRPPGKTPVAAGRRGARSFARGAVAGVGLVAGAVALLASTGSYEVSARACRAESLLRFVVGSGGFLLLAAAFEELLFRGYGLFALREAAGPATAVAATALLFMAAHAGNPGFGLGAASNLALVGAVLAAWVLATEDVWVAVGAHAGWNAAIVLGAAVPVSGMAVPAPCHAGILTGPDWMTGGAFGLEAGLPTALVWIAFAGWLWRRAGRRI